MRRAVGQQPPKFSTTIAFGEAEHRLHHVLDPDHRDAEPVAGRAHDVDRRLQLGVVEPGHHLVEEQQPGSTGERPGEIEEALLVEVERADVVVGRGPPGATNPSASSARSNAVACVGPPIGRTEQGAEHDVLADRHLGERARRLQDHGDPGPTGPVRRQPRHVGSVKPDRSRASAGSRPLIVLSSVLLPAPLGPTRARISPSSTRRRHAVDGGQAAEVLLDTIEFEERHCVGVGATSAGHVRLERVGHDQRLGLPVAGLVEPLWRRSGDRSRRTPAGRRPSRPTPSSSCRTGSREGRTSRCGGTRRWPPGRRRPPRPPGRPSARCRSRPRRRPP